MWRPDNWPECPCNNCKEREEDEYGLLCDIACGQHTAWANKEAGADAMLEALFKLAQESPTKTFTIDSRIIQAYGELKQVNKDKIMRHIERGE